jgi:hypothetical protein
MELVRTKCVSFPIIKYYRRSYSFIMRGMTLRNLWSGLLKYF